MYQHILVPVDGTELSTHTATQAVNLALETKARVTFLYAAPDFGATSDGALLRTVAPEKFSELAVGSTHAILTKVVQIAKAKGVACDEATAITDRPYEAIVRTAKEKNCDLIFMASHGVRGLRGLVRGSQTEKVLRHSSIPVLVSSVESNDPHAAMHRALAVIHDEHRSLDVVMQGLLDYSEEVVRAGKRIDVDLLRRMIGYLRDFPGTLHHPKEEKYIFAKLRQRTHDFDDLLDTLQRQHHHERMLVANVESALAQAATDAGAKAFDDALCELAGHIQQHLGHEERTLLPAARAYLAEEDWVEIDAAFGENHEPGFNETDGGFSRMFAKIANLLPEPDHKSLVA